ncbi:MAG: hypothetical protein AVDCRST_MAG90-707, partial [uncultured Microvirga sp.]
PAARATRSCAAGLPARQGSARRRRARSRGAAPVRRGSAGRGRM